MAIGKKIHSGKFTKAAPTKFIGAAMGVVGGVMNMIGGGKAARRAAAQQKEAQAEMDKRVGEFEAIDTSNLYAGIQTDFENVYEDATVDQRAAEFQAQQGAQQRSNIMETMRAGAGGSGIAALAQSMASQGQLAAQQQAAGIGQQEQANRAAMLAGAEATSKREQQAKMQILAGEQASRAATTAKTEKLMGLASGKLQAASKAKEAADAQRKGGLGQILGGVTGALTGGIGGKIMKGIGGKIGSALGKTKLGGAFGKLAAAGGAKIGETPGFMSGAAEGALGRAGYDSDKITDIQNLYGLND